MKINIYIDAVAQWLVDRSHRYNGSYPLETSASRHLFKQNNWWPLILDFVTVYHALIVRFWQESEEWSAEPKPLCYCQPMENRKFFGRPVGLIRSTFNFYRRLLRCNLIYEAYISWKRSHSILGEQIPLATIQCAREFKSVNKRICPNFPVVDVTWNESMLQQYRERK